MDSNSFIVEAKIDITKETVDDQGLVFYTNFIQNKTKLFISITDKKFPILKASTMLIMQMANKTIEEWVLFTYYPPDTITQPKKLTDKEEPLLANDKNDKYAKLNNSVINSTNVSIRVPLQVKEDIAMTIKEHSIIGRYYQLAKKGWYFFYILFLIGGVSLLIHFIIILATLKFSLNVYIFVLVLLIILLLVAGYYGIRVNHNAEKVLIKPLHYLGGACVLVTLCFFFFLNSTMMGIEIFNSINAWSVCYYVGFSVLFVAEAFTVFMNYKMDQFYKKYRERLLPNSLIIGDFGFDV